MTRSDTSLAAQRRYVRLEVSPSLDGARLSFAGGETVGDYRSADTAWAALRTAEIATADVLSRVFGQ